MQADRSFGSLTRKRAFLAFTALIFSAFTARLVQLQLIEGSNYRSRSESQGIKQVVREPIRGALYDRYGHAIVANIPSYSVLVTPNKITPDSKQTLARILGTDTSTINEKIKQYKINDFSPVRIWRDVDHKAWAMLNEWHTELTGVDIVEESKRAYAGDIHASHILGYTKEISKDEILRLGDYYQPGDVIGKSGIEQAYEDHLRGEKGYEFVAVNNRGQRVNAFNDGKNDRQPSNGFDLYLSLDGGLQQYAEQLLQGYHGAVVAIDPTNGEILAIASAPDYDPKVFSGVTSPGDYAKLADDPGKPLMNRATQAVYPPGSTWKMLIGIAALQEGLITENTTFSCPGSFSYGGNSWKCHGAHTVNVRKALQVSCNSFFGRLGLQMGIDVFNKYGRLFHFGERLGTDVPEGLTRLPSREYYDKAFGTNKWPKGVMVNLGIGQGELGVNPLQLAAYTAAIANGGTWNQPHLVRAIKNGQLGQIERVKYESEDLGIRKDIMDIVHKGMFDVVNVAGGTAFRNARLDSIQIAGKTGTAQAGKGKEDHAWFVCYAPFDKPKIALCVLVENIGYGGTFSAPIARKLVRYYLTRQRESPDLPGSDGLDNPNSLRDIGDVQESTMLPEELKDWD